MIRFVVFAAVLLFSALSPSISWAQQQPTPTINMSERDQLVACVNFCVASIERANGQLSVGNMTACARSASLCGLSMSRSVAGVMQAFCMHPTSRGNGAYGCSAYGGAEPRGNDDASQQPPVTSGDAGVQGSADAGVTPRRAAPPVPEACRNLTGQSRTMCIDCVQRGGERFEVELQIPEQRVNNGSQELVFPAIPWRNVCFHSASAYAAALTGRLEEVFNARIARVEQRVGNLETRVEVLENQPRVSGGGTVSDDHIREIANQAIDARLTGNNPVPGHPSQLPSDGQLRSELNTINARVDGARNTADLALRANAGRLETWNFTSISLAIGGFVGSSNAGTTNTANRPVGGPLATIHLLHRVSYVAAFYWGGGFGLSFPMEPDMRFAVMGDLGFRFHGPTWFAFELGAGVLTRVSGDAFNQFDIGGTAGIVLGPNIRHGNGVEFRLNGLFGVAVQGTPMGVPVTGGYGGAIMTIGYSFGGPTVPGDGAWSRAYFDQPPNIPGRENQRPNNTR